MNLADHIETYPKALTVKVLAELLACSQKKIVRMVHGCKIPHFRIGSQIRFDPQAVADWLREKEVRATNRPRRV